jgi:putative acetyltransferase
VGGDWQIRPEGPGDAAAIRGVHQAAFGGDEEADIVAAFAVSRCATASFVAVDRRGHVVGHLTFSPVAIDGVDERRWAEGLAPLGVLPGFQGRGVGTDLVRHGLRALVRAGRRAVVVLGHPSYYTRFGFQPARSFGLSWEVSGHEDAFMALELEPGALSAGAGVVRYRPEVMGFSVAPAPREAWLDIQALERVAATRFRGTLHAVVADSPPLSLDELERFSAIGGLWVASSKRHSLAAYIAWEPRDNDAYVVEVDVHPDCAGGRLGAALLDQVELLASRAGLSRLLLRTFSDIPWNAPYYQRLGFRALPELPQTLVDVLGEEAAMGLDPSRRVTMARDVSIRRHGQVSTLNHS